MSQRHLDKLRDLTESASLSTQVSSGAGRYARTPNFSAPSARSSRPRSDRGTTFHFSHKVVSKRNDISESNRSQTTSAAHQGYIERPSATEEAEKDTVASLENAHQPHVEDGLISTEYFYPDRVVDPARASFGTLGHSKAERREFWNEVEHHEPRKSRVQSRIIAELPHELGAPDRARLAQDFCHVFEEMGLPYWATIHEPGKRNDDKNFHLHITYFDRPSGRREDGTWAHAHTETRRKKSRHLYTVRPDVSSKHPDTRRIDWPKKLRRNFADAANFHLANAGHEKRYDPRPYRESGIRKEPTEHLGNKVSALETMGLDTVAGQRNAKREIRWKIAQAEAPWRDRYESIKDENIAEWGGEEADHEELTSLLNQGITTARKSASLSIVSDLLTRRVTQRSDFLGAEVSRLSSKEDMSDFTTRATTIAALSSERDVLDDAIAGLQDTARKTRTESERHDEMNRNLLRAFDLRRRLIDPGFLFDSETGSELDSAGTLRAEDERPDPFDTADMRNIEDLFGDDATPRDQQKKRGAKKPGMPRIEQIIQHIVDDPNGERSAGIGKQAKDAFPDAWSIQPTKDKVELNRLDQSLASLDNRHLRQTAIASRDAADLCDDAQERTNFARGWAVLRYEADRRGVDLDTGHHRPDLANDPERARLHADQDPCPIRVVRKNIARQRVR